MSDVNSNQAAVVRLEILGDSNVDALTQAAFSGASPVEVMPQGAAEWSDDAKVAYRAYLDTTDDTTYLVLSESRVVGAIRLAERDSVTAETGIWLCREARGAGNGTAAVRTMLDEARRSGYRVLVAEVERDNTPALRALQACGAATYDSDDVVSAEIAVPMGTFRYVGGTCLFEYAADAPVLHRVSDLLDTVIGATWGVPVDRIVLPADRLAPEFFDLSTKLAGDMLQKLTTYRLHTAIVGDVSTYLERSSALRDFVRECDRGQQVWFLADETELRQRLVG